MTATDDLKSALSAYLDTTESRLSALESAVTALDSPAAPPAPDLPEPNDPAGDQPSDSPPPQQNDPHPISEPLSDPAVVTFATFDVKSPYHPARGATNIIALSKRNNPTWSRKPDDVATGAPVFGDSHNGGTVVLDGCIAFFQWGSLTSPPTQIWPATPVPLPDGVWTANAPQPASSKPAASEPVPLPATAIGQVIPKIDMPPPGTAILDLSVEMAFADGTTVTLNGSNAKPFADITVPFASLAIRHSRVTSPDGLAQADFYLDADGSRLEIEWQLGAALLPTAHTWPDYTITFKARGVGLGTYSVPHHFYNSQPRVATSDRPDARMISDITILPKIAPLPITRREPGLVPAYTLMGHCDLTVFLGQTGGRPDLGRFSNYEAALMGTSSDVQRFNVRSWAEVSCTAGWHLYDADGRMFDFSANPNASVFSSTKGAPPLYIEGGDPNNMDTAIRPDYAHAPSLDFIQFLLTGDPKAAKELMHQANYYLGGEHNDGGATHAIYQKRYGAKTFIVDAGSERGYAATLGLAVDSYIASTLITDETLLPTPFWKMVMNRNRDFLMDQCVNNSDVRAAVFGAGPANTAFSSWQQDRFYVLLGYMEGTGLFPDWQPIFDWAANGLLARFSAPNCGDGTWYYAWCGSVSMSTDASLTLINGHYNGWTNGAVVDYLLTMTDATNFTVRAPDGSTRTGMLGKQYGGTDEGKDHGLNFILSGTPNAGDTATITVTAAQSYEEFFALNPPSTKFSGEYPSIAYSAMTLLGKKRPALKAIRDRYLADLESHGASLDWKYSYAA